MIEEEMMAEARAVNNPMVSLQIETWICSKLCFARIFTLTSKMYRKTSSIAIQSVLQSALFLNCPKS